jgi:hypothetical protein
LGVPNLITPEDIEQRREKLQSKFDLPDKPCIGVLLGGEDRHFTITQATADKLVDTLLKVCDKIGGQLALTTSRRTPQVVEEIMYSRLDKDNRCILLELTSRNDSRSQGKLPEIPETVASIFAISDIVIVTEDSFSMVCEAASSGRKVIILDVDRKSKLLGGQVGCRPFLRKPGKTKSSVVSCRLSHPRRKRATKRLPKRHRTYNSIMESTQTVKCSVDDFEEMLLKVANERVKCQALRDAKKAADAIINYFQYYS